MGLLRGGVIMGAQLLVAPRQVLLSMAIEVAERALLDFATE